MARRILPPCLGEKPKVVDDVIPETARRVSGHHGQADSVGEWLALVALTR